MPGEPLHNVDDALRSYWHPVARIDQLGTGPRRVTVLGEALVVCRLGGTVAVMADRCPHRWAPLSAGHVVDDTLECPYHGWRFGADGACVHVPAVDTPPARASACAYPTREAYGLVWAALAPPVVELLDVPEWHEAGHVVAWLPTVTMRCGAAQFVDNFLDFAHFPFVHRGTFGADEDRHVAPYSVDTDTDSLTLHYEHKVANREDPLVASGEHPLLQTRHMDYSYRVPFAARLRLHYTATGVINTIAAWAVPIDAGYSRLFCALIRNDLEAPDSPAARHAVEYESSVLAEDLAVIEHLGTTDFALDLTDQLHTRADRITVEFRRLLAKAVGR